MSVCARREIATLDDGGGHISALALTHVSLLMAQRLTHSLAIAHASPAHCLIALTKAAGFVIGWRPLLGRILGRSWRGQEPYLGGADLIPRDLDHCKCSSNPGALHQSSIHSFIVFLTFTHWHSPHTSFSISLEAPFLISNQSEIRRLSIASLCLPQQKLKQFPSRSTSREFPPPPVHPPGLRPRSSLLGSVAQGASSHLTLTRKDRLSHSGGLEMLFDNQRRHSVALPAVDGSGKPATIAFLIDYICKTLLKDPRTDLFVLDNHMYVVAPPPLRSFLISVCLHPPIPVPGILLLLTRDAAAPASWCSLTTPTGSSRARRPTRSSRATTSCLSRPCTGASQRAGRPPVLSRYGCAL